MSNLPSWKTGVAGALLFLLVFQAAGWFFAWGVVLFEAHHRVQTLMHRRETPLQHITISTKLFADVRVGKKEIRLGGQLYDIKDQQLTGDSIRLHLYHDLHEETLLKALGHLIAPGVGGSADQPPLLQQWLAKWLGSTYLAPPLQTLYRLYEAAARPVFSFLLLPAQHMPSCTAPPPKLP